MRRNHYADQSACGRPHYNAPPAWRQALVERADVIVSPLDGPRLSRSAARCWRGSRWLAEARMTARPQKAAASVGVAAGALERDGKRIHRCRGASSSHSRAVPAVISPAPEQRAVYALDCQVGSHAMPGRICGCSISGSVRPRCRKACAAIAPTAWQSSRRVGRRRSTCTWWRLTGGLDPRFPHLR